MFDPENFQNSQTAKSYSATHEAIETKDLDSQAATPLKDAEVSERYLEKDALLSPENDRSFAAVESDNPANSNQPEKPLPPCQKDDIPAALSAYDQAEAEEAAETQTEQSLKSQPAPVGKASANIPGPSLIPGDLSAKAPLLSDTFDPDRWEVVPGFEDLVDLTYHRGVALSPSPAEKVTLPGRQDITAGLAGAQDSTLIWDRRLGTARLGAETTYHPENAPSEQPNSVASVKPGGRISALSPSSLPADAPSDYSKSERSASSVGRPLSLADSPVQPYLPVVRIAFNRPLLRNAFRPQTVDELYRVLDHARQDPQIGAIILTGNGPSPKDGGYSFCSGGDQQIRDRGGYRYETATGEVRQTDQGRLGRLHILEVQRLIRSMPKVVIAAIPGWTAGGGHSLMVVCDLAVASLEHARFKQTDANVGSFDGGYGSGLLSRQVGDKRARQIFFLAQTYSAKQAEEWGVINQAVPHHQLETTALEWALSISRKSPQAIRMLKYAFNLPDEGLVGQQLFAGEATRMAYRSDEAEEGRLAFLERREPDWSAFPYYY